MAARCLSFLLLVLAFVTCGTAARAQGSTDGSGAPAPVVIGFDGEFGHRTSTSATAIRDGILLAIDEINGAGGVLGGRPLRLETRDNRSVPARGIQNLKDLSAIPDMVGVFVGKFSPVVLEMVPVAHDLRMLILDPWAAADEIVDNGRVPNYVFRLSLRDSWAMPALLQAAYDRGFRRIALMVPNTAWGRSNLAAMTSALSRFPDVELVSESIYNWGEKSLADKLAKAHAAGADAVVLVANETEGSLFVREMAARPAAEHLPVFSHWGIAGGAFVDMTGGALNVVDLSVVQTFTFTGLDTPKARDVLAGAGRLFGADTPAQIPSHVGFAHAYDLTHLLARAVDQAGTTDRAAIRDAMERLGPHDGLVRRYDPPFTPDRHEALGPEDVFVGRFLPDGTVSRN